MKTNEVFVAVEPTSSYDGYCIFVKAGREMYPLIYLRKPKAVSQKSFDEAMLKIEVGLPDDFDFELEAEPETKRSAIKVAK